MNKQRERTYDIMKGIGILLVLVGHIWQWNESFVHVAIYSFHMPLFFIVAGCFSKSYYEVKGMIREIVFNYIKRLYFPVVLITIFLSIWYIIKTINKAKYANYVITTLLSSVWASSIPLHTRWGDVTCVVWFLMALLCAKILFLFLSKWNYWGGLLSIVVSVGALFISAYKPLIPWCLLQGMVALPLVFIGWWWHKCKVPEWVGGICVPFWICAILFSHQRYFTLQFGCYPLDMVGSIGGTWIIYQMSRGVAQYTRYTSQVLSFIGVCSLSIYCWHSFDISGSVFHQILCLIGLPDNVVLDYILRYTLTIIVGITMTRIPILKKVFA